MLDNARYSRRMIFNGDTIRIYLAQRQRLCIIRWVVSSRSRLAVNYTVARPHMAALIALTSSRSRRATEMFNSILDNAAYVIKLPSFTLN